MNDLSIATRIDRFCTKCAAERGISPGECHNDNCDFYRLEERGLPYSEGTWTGLVHHHCIGCGGTNCGELSCPFFGIVRDMGKAVPHG